MGRVRTVLITDGSTYLTVKLYRSYNRCLRHAAKSPDNVQPVFKKENGQFVKNRFGIEIAGYAALPKLDSRYYIEC